MQTKIKDIKTFCPVFSGFYNSIWQYDDNYIIEYLNEDRQKHQHITFDHLKIDYKEYEKNIAIAFCNELSILLDDYIVNIAYENIYSPKEYNFSTDSINCIITPKIDNIQKFIYDNKEHFCQYLKKHYTSCDGFISGYSNNFDIWETETNIFSNFESNGHFLGSILQFICNELEIEEINIYYNIEIDYIQYVENYDQLLNAVICTNCNNIIDDQNILKDIKKYTDLMQKTPSKILCNECLENI